MTIPAGYRFTFDSWENDADNNKTKILEGVSLEDAQFLSELCKILQAQGTGLENEYEPDDKTYKKAFKILKPLFKKYKKPQNDIYEMCDYIAENILDYSAEEYGLRVLDGVKVQYIPQDILIEDVTAKFF